jgi:hypothetical protein
MIVQLRDENIQMERKIKKHLESCKGSLENNKKMVKRSFPLHGQVKNLYILNRELQKNNRSKKE